MFLFCSLNTAVVSILVTQAGRHQIEVLALFFFYYLRVTLNTCMQDQLEPASHKVSHVPIAQSLGCLT